MTDFLAHYFQGLGVAGQRGLVVSIGGAADIVLARALAIRLAVRGAVSVDIAQTLAVGALTEKQIDQSAWEPLALCPVPGFPPEVFLRHYGRVANQERKPRDRGKGKRISAAIDLPTGQRFMVAGATTLWDEFLLRPWSVEGAYDFVIGVDGGGDVIGIDRGCDMRVLDALATAMPAEVRFRLAVIGLGADGTSIEELESASLPGWAQEAEFELPRDFADELEAGLRQASCWLDDPSRWGLENPEWNWDLKVPQIVALAIRGESPYGYSNSGNIYFPRRGKQMEMRHSWIRSARFYSHTGTNTGLGSYS